MNAILLINFGTPQNRSEVGPFLVDIFADYYGLLAKPIALMARRSAIKKYESVGFTPLPSLPFFTAAQYGRPSIEDVLEKIESEGFERVKILPLYPHASAEMFDLIVEKCLKLKQLYFRDLRFSWVGPFYDHPLFIEAWAESVKNSLEGPSDHIIFSAHAIPSSSESSLYESQVEFSAHSIMRSSGSNPYSVAYQSSGRIGKWSRPSLEEVLRKLDGVSNILIAPISFLFDNVETLFDIALLKVRWAKPPGDSEKIAQMLVEITK